MAKLRCIVLLLILLFLNNTLLSKEVKILFSTKKSNQLDFKKIEKNKFNVNDEFLQKIVLKYDLFKVKKLRLKNIFKNYDLFEAFFLTENIENLISDLKKSKAIYEFNIINNVENKVLGESKIEMDNPDPLFEQQEALFKMKFPEAWDLTTGNKNVIIAIFDTGTDWYHPDMKDNIFINNAEMQNANIDWVNGQIYGDGIDNDGNGYIDDVIGWDFKNNDNNPFIEDYHFGDSGDHGAKTSSVCGAVSNNGQFISGTNWNVSILGMKVDGSFYGWITNSIEAIDYCVGIGVNVINMSYGSSSWYNQTLFHQAIQDAYNNHNILFVSIAQNYNNETKVYPGAWPEVMALAATMLDDTKKSDSNYGDWVECTATVEKNGFLNYNFSTHNHIGYVSTGATSTAAPLTSGLAGLLMALNPYLSNVQVRNIINETCDNIDAANPAYIGKLGSGRINAYQAVLLGAAYANKSQYSTATYSNNARHLVKNGGYLYEIFTSGGEIFFRRSNDGGSTWQSTKRLSAGNGSNSRPAISAFYDNSLHVVWQRKVADNKWDIYYTYSTDQGNSWSTLGKIAQNVPTSSYQNNGPQPVIAYCFVQEQTMELMTVYASYNGIYYTTKTSASGSWPTPINISGSYNNKIRFPSLAGDMGYFTLVYDTRYNGVYSRTYDGTWSSEAKFNWEGSYARETCVAKEKQGGSMLAAFVARPTSSSPFSLYFRKGYENNTWSNFKKRFDEINGKDYRRPSLTYFDANYANEFAVSIVSHTSANRIVMHKYYGQSDSWQENHIANNGREANITGYSYTSPKYCWTDQSSSPYLVKLSSTYLPKTAQPTEYRDIYARNTVIANSLDGSSQVLEVSDYVVRTKSGKEYRIAFHKYPDDTTKLTMENIWNYMDSEPVKLPEDAVELNYYKKIFTIFPDDSTNKQSHSNVFSSTSYQLAIADAHTKSILKVLDDETKSGNVTVDISSFAGKEIILYPALKIGLKDKAELHFELTDIFYPFDKKLEKLSSKDALFVKENVPEQAVLFANYPNPFNPRTTIRFALPKEGYVQLNIYSVNGQKVRTLINGQVSKGYHQIVWDGKNESGQAVSGGLYFYELKTENKRFLKKMLLVK